MTTEITFQQLWFNHSLLNFFFRSQSEATLNELIERSSLSTQKAVEHLNDALEDYDLDDVEEMFYNDSVEELAKEFDLPLSLDDDEDDDEDEE